MKLSGAQIVVKSLVDMGVEVVFGYPGGAVLPIYDAIFQQNELRHILVRHEQAAVHAAEGYARSTGKVGAVLVTSGPGATNAVTGLADALMDSIPLVCLTGQVPTHLIGNDAFQEADTVGITRPCTKHNYLIKNVDDLARTLAEAFYVARSGRPGPVVVDLPKDVANAETDYEPVGDVTHKSYRPITNAGTEAIEEAVDLIAGAKRPILYAGGGVINSGDHASKLLHKLAKATGAPVTTTLMGLGCFPAEHPQFLGMLGMHGTYEANMSMHVCDVMVAIGARFDDRVTGRLTDFSPGSTKIQIDIDPSSINKNVPVELPLVGDVSCVLEAMLETWKRKRRAPKKAALKSWWRQIDAWRAVDCLKYAPSETTIKPQYALQRLQAATAGRDVYFTTEVGQHQMWAAQYLHFAEPRRWMTSGGLGTMGYGFPAAVGVQLAHPDSLVIDIAGEASFLMNMQELSTVKQYRLPVKVFILNNEYMGMVRQWQEFFHGGRYAESYTDSLPDFVALAESYGMKGLRATKPAEVDGLIAAMIAHPGPVIADVCIDKTENVYPMIPAGAGHHEMKLGADDQLPSRTEEGMVLV
ncbi:MAG: acetolactate synthase 3 large subunit [Alphaproteobacteria bacterium]|jgi:acetolactate synthase-1/2/3 large subunit|nr:acetolactate synthase 3 large subunit [Alphaproteobacteria bacterium]MDP6516204.1 acetolactate synthase 3 large subunit [Alphaproteobacteria bacterium]